MKLRLLSLDIENFKGINAGRYEFADKTKISGANATGKTSVFDAFTWLFFNKDSSGAEKFSVRPLDKNGNTVDNVDIRVTAVIETGGKEIEFTKIQRQKKNAITQEIQGNENIFMIDGFSYKEKEFKARMGELIDEEAFKVLSSPTYFLNLNWKKQREILSQFVGEINDVAFAEQLGGYDALIPKIESAPSLADLQKKNASLIKIFKERINEFFIRVDELERTKHKLSNDFDIVDKRISELSNDMRKTSQDMADVEKLDYLLERYISEKTENISGIINSKFEGVLFRLFEMQLNGNVKDCCEATVDGVPYGSLNAGHKIVAGLQIIKALQKLYDVYIPIFIDNAESINDFNMPKMDCQLVMMAVSDDRELKVEVV